MRIGILTFHRSINNGAFMQCYALSKRLRQDFPDVQVEVVDYNLLRAETMYDTSLQHYFCGGTAMTKFKRAVKLLLDPLKLQKLKRRKEMFRQALTHLPLSETAFLSDLPTEAITYINHRYDAVVVGSDAVWNYTSRRFPNIYFPDASVNLPKLSYAASCYGMDFLAEEQNRQAIGDCLRDFSFLGVRDKATEDFVKWGDAALCPVHTCDPTAFLDVNDLPVDEQIIRQKLEKRGFDFSKPTIGVMGTSAMMKMVRSFFGRQYQVAALYEPTPGADVQLYDLSPLEWAYVFRFFKLTFTTYFHGTMLSLRNGVPLICIALKTKFAKRHTPKTLDVLTRLGYADWYFETDYKAQNFERIKAKAEELLTADKKAEILGRLDKEAESYEFFRQALQKVITDVNKGEGKS